MMFITLDQTWNHKFLNMSIIPGSVALCWDWMWTSIAYSSKVGNEVLMSSDIWTFGVDLRFHKCHRYLPTSDIIANTAPFPRNSRKDCGRDDMDVTFVTQRKGIGLPTLLTFAWRLHESWGNLRMLMTDDRWQMTDFWRFWRYRHSSSLQGMIWNHNKWSPNLNAKKSCKEWIGRFFMNC